MKKLLGAQKSTKFIGFDDVILQGIDDGMC